MRWTDYEITRYAGDITTWEHEMNVLEAQREIYERQKAIEVTRTR